jgi:multidrug efflux pump subunit AcrB
MSFGSVTIQIYAQPGQNAGDIAEQVRRVLQEEESRRARAGRSAYVDD